MVAARSRPLKWNVRALAKESGMPAAPAERLVGDIHFDPAVIGPLEKLFGQGERIARRFTYDFGEHRLPKGIVDGAAVIGINQAQVPQFASLVEIRHARRSYLEQRLRK